MDNSTLGSDEMILGKKKMEKKNPEAEFKCKVCLMEVYFMFICRYCVFGCRSIQIGPTLLKNV